MPGHESFSVVLGMARTSRTKNAVDSMQRRHAGFDGALRVAVPFLNPLSPAMNAASMCGINFVASTASPYACACSAT